MSSVQTPFATIEEAIEDIRQGKMVVVVDDENRENEGDLTMAAQFITLRGDQLHGQGGARADLPVAHPRALRRARARPDGGQERVGVRDRVHDLDRGSVGRQHGHLGRRPRPHDPGRDRSQDQPARARPARPRVSFEGQAGRGAGARRSDRGGGRPRPARRPDPGRGDLRDHERRRHDGASARPRAVLRAPRPQDGHGRGSGRLPPPAREAGRAGRLDQAPDRVRRVHGRRVPLAGRQQAPRCARQGRRRRSGRCARPRALGVPDR